MLIAAYEHLLYSFLFLSKQVLNMTESNATLGETNQAYFESVIPLIVLILPITNTPMLLIKHGISKSHLWLLFRTL